MYSNTIASLNAEIHKLEMDIERCKLDMKQFESEMKLCKEDDTRRGMLALYITQCLKDIEKLEQELEEPRKKMLEMNNKMILELEQIQDEEERKAKIIDQLFL